MLREKIRQTPLGIIGRTPGEAPADEPDMAALLHEFDMEIRIPRGTLPDLLEDICGKERIIRCAQQERRDPDASQPGDRAGSRVIIVGIGEAMERGSDRVIECMKGAPADESTRRDPAGKAGMLDGGLPVQ
jgi:hypothetical protein